MTLVDFVYMVTMLAKYICQFALTCKNLIAAVVMSFPIKTQSTATSEKVLPRFS